MTDASNASPQKDSDIFKFVSRSVEEPEQLGERLGRLMSGGDVVALIGELGSGKTTLIRGLAKGLGIEPDRVKSPTFVLLREYPAAVPLVHIDGYRLQGEASLVWEDLAWVFAPTKVTVIEWADRFARCLPEDHLELQFAHRSTNQRALTLIAHGQNAQRVLTALESQRDSHEPAGY